MTNKPTTIKYEKLDAAVEKIWKWMHRWEAKDGDAIDRQKKIIAGILIELIKEHVQCKQET